MGEQVRRRKTGRRRTTPFNINIFNKQVRRKKTGRRGRNSLNKKKRTASKRTKKSNVPVNLDAVPVNLDAVPDNIDVNGKPIVMKMTPTGPGDLDAFSLGPINPDKQKEREDELFNKISADRNMIIEKNDHSMSMKPYVNKDSLIPPPLLLGGVLSKRLKKRKSNKKKRKSRRN